MGTWGVGTFENDDAGDWVYSLEECDDLSVIEASLDLALEDSELIEAPTCCEALAAAEVVAALAGRPVSGLPEEVTKWVPGKPKPSAPVVSKAKRAVELVLSDKSELFELFKEADEGDFAAWKKVVADLKGRLG